jgi:hypothetical protein
MQSDGFEFKIIYSDNDIHKLNVSAWNGTFGGTADVYVSIGELRKVAAKLTNFPRSLGDTCEHTFGGFGRQAAGGAVFMRFSSADR